MDHADALVVVDGAVRAGEAHGAEAGRGDPRAGAAEAAASGSAGRGGRHGSTVRRGARTGRVERSRERSTLAGDAPCADAGGRDRPRRARRLPAPPPRAPPPGRRGAAAGARRRTPGLRREEVAALAGVSADYYTRLEQARGPHPSASVVAAVARALRCEVDERDHLFHLAGLTPPPRRAGRHVPPGLMRLVDHLTEVPVLVLSDLTEVLWQNRLADALTGPLAPEPGRAQQRGLALVHRFVAARDVPARGPGRPVGIARAGPAGGVVATGRGRGRDLARDRPPRGERRVRDAVGAPRGRRAPRRPQAVPPPRGRPRRGDLRGPAHPGVRPRAARALPHRGHRRARRSSTCCASSAPRSCTRPGRERAEDDTPG